MERARKGTEKAAEAASAATATANAKAKAGKAGGASTAAMAGEEATTRSRPATRPERTSRRSRKTRRDLIDAACTLLEEQGVHALTVKAVTDRADVGHGTFYHHFTSTEDVLAAGIEESIREFASAMGRDFVDADDKSWVFVASMSRIFRMLAGHPALAWMLERPCILAAALREACGPFALRDLDAMVTAGEVRPEALVHATRYTEWIMIGALVETAANPAGRRSNEQGLLELVLRVLGLKPARVAGLLERLYAADAAGRKRAGR